MNLLPAKTILVKHYNLILDSMPNKSLMAQTFLDAGIVSGGTQCHMFTVDLRKEQFSGREYAWYHCKQEW